MAENRFEFRYSAGDVASAQRMRFLRSNQLKVLIGVWLVSSLFLAAPMVFPQMFPGSPFTSWALVLEIAIIYAVTMVVIIAVTPYLDFTFNRFWRLPLLFQYNDKQLKLSVVNGKSPGLRLTWNQLQRIEENERVFVMYYGAGNKFLILPKSVFSEASLERFHSVLRRKLSLPGKEQEAALEGAAPEGAAQQGAAQQGAVQGNAADDSADELE